MLPVGPAEWINRHSPEGNVFCDYNASSNLVYLTRPHRPVPILTNTWAYPPYLLRRIGDIVAGRAPLEAFADEYGVGVVVASTIAGGQEMISRLARSREWAIVHLEAKFVVFLRRTAADAALLGREEKTRYNFDVAEFVARVTRDDPVPAAALHDGAVLLSWIGWDERSEPVLRRCLELAEDFPEALVNLGGLLAKRASGRIEPLREHLRRGRTADAQYLREKILSDFHEAERLLRRCLKVRPGYGPAEANLLNLRENRQRLTEVLGGVPPGTSLRDASPAPAGRADSPAIP
jgi:hypothetical protein